MTPQQIDAIVALGVRWEIACDDLRDLFNEADSCTQDEHEYSVWLDAAAYNATLTAKHAYDALVAQIHQIVVETYVDAD